MLQVVRHPDARAFLQRAEPWLVETEMENGIALTSARNASLDESHYEKPTYWATIEDDGRIAGCAFRTPPYRLGVTALDDTAIAALLASVTTVYPRLSGVTGPEPTVNVLAGAWCRLHGTTEHVGARHRLYSLRVLIPPPRSPRGTLRLATDGDAAIVHAWGEAFIREARIEHVRPSFFGPLIKAQQVYLWDDGEPRCMAAALRHTPRASAIGVLFTPPALRGAGYGTATVAALSDRLFAGGTKGCYLFADPENTAASRIVGGIGYERVHDTADIDFR
jgi:uncharacterized protein